MKSFDSRFAARELPNDNLDSDNFRPEEALTSYALLNPDGKDITVAFPPRGNGGAWYNLLTKRLARAGDAVLSLSFHDQLLSPDIYKTATAFRLLGEDIASLLDTITAARSYRIKKAVSLSMGHPVLDIVHGMRPFDAVTMVTPGDRLSSCMWEGDRTQNIRKKIELDDRSLAQVHVAFGDISPIDRVDQYKDVDVTIIASQNENIIPTANQRRYIEAMRAQGVDTTVVWSPLGHYLTNASFCLLGRR